MYKKKKTAKKKRLTPEAKYRWWDKLAQKAEKRAKFWWRKSNG